MADINKAREDAALASNDGQDPGGGGQGGDSQDVLDGSAPPRGGK
eukprot:CAMPEP_0180166466 /NCGR_PEP_ID=MMETSP0986-20121125/31590_1 /TAXON_ID=697907 /ORGANISM="non described non described, Strain CCMP2293" /LENGTH=44 /DNA_ID= /DNA_START= /DNA_END= /DNA_ORIENTATION=